MLDNRDIFLNIFQKFRRNFYRVLNDYIFLDIVFCFENNECVVNIMFMESFFWVDYCY